MKKLRKGFTMVELIFVIVIIGILVSIAMPKLAASRDDAKFHASLASLKQAISNAKSFYTADPKAFRAGNITWMGHENNYDNRGPDGFCFDVGTSTGGKDMLYILPHKGADKAYSKCDLDEATQTALYEEAGKIGLLNSDGSRKIEYLGRRKIKI